jgi:hypothetical protein
VFSHHELTMNILLSKPSSVNFDAYPKRHRAAIAQSTLGALVAEHPIQDKTVSVDTIAVTVRISSLFDAPRYGFKLVSRYKQGKLKNKPSKRWQFNFEHSTGATVKITYTRKFGHWLTVETSLPKFLYGSNFRVLTYAERIEAVKGLSVAVSERLGFAIDLLRDGIGKRLDLFQHIRLGSENNLRLAVDCVKQLSFSYRKLETNDFADSAAWRSKTHRLEIYNKSAERLANNEIVPAGILKIESQFKDGYFWRGYSIAELLKDDVIRQMYFAHLWQ